uniref:Transposase n=1 Tax=Mesocestoides corti TaxID=53468 RepID=A0A5K3FWY5_MESCO
LLTNHKPGPHVRRRQSESTTLATPVGCISSSHAIGTQRDRGLPEASLVEYVCALIRRHSQGR